MQPIYIASSLGALLLAVIYRPEWISLVVVAGATLAVAAFLVAVAVTAYKALNWSNSSNVYPKQPPELEAMRKYLIGLEPRIERPLRLPVVFGRMIDGILQQLLELVLRDYVGAWFNDVGFKSDDIIQDLKSLKQTVPSFPFLFLRRREHGEQ